MLFHPLPFWLKHGGSLTLLDSVLYSLARTMTVISKLVAVAPDGSTKVTCTDCKKEVERTDVQVLGGDQCRCNGCNSLRSRIGRAVKAFQIEGYDNLPHGSRADLLKAAENLYGMDLAKLIVDTCTKTSIARNTLSYEAGGGFLEMDDAEEKYKKKPLVWASILENAPRMTCSIRGCEMIQIPQYTATDKTENINQLEKKRKVEAETTAKPKKLPKKPKQEVQVQDPGSDAVVSAALKKRLEAQVAKVRELGLSLATNFAEASAPDVAEHMAPKTLKSAAELQETIETACAKAEPWIASSIAPKGAPAVWLEEMKLIIKDYKSTNEKLEEAVADSKN